MTFAARSAHIGVHFTTPDGQVHQFTYVLARSAASSQQDVLTTVPVSLRYDLCAPQDAVAEADYAAARTRGMLTALAGGVVGVSGFFPFPPARQPGLNQAFLAAGGHSRVTFHNMT